MACYTYKGKTYTKEELLAIKNQIIAENETVFNQMGSEALNDVNVLVDQLVKSGLTEEVIVENTQTLTNELDKLTKDKTQKQEIKLIPTGFVKGKKVYINSDVATVETPIHEFAHLYNAWLKENKAELYNRGLELVRAELDKKNSPIQSVIDYVKSTQPNLKGEAFEEEVLTQLTGKKGLDLLQSKKKGGIIDWIKEALAEIANMLGLSNYSVEQAMNMTLDEFAKAIAVDLLRGEKLYPKATEAENYYQRNADRLPLTLSVFNRPEFLAMQGKMVNPITVLNSLNQTGIKQVEKDLIKGVIEENYPGQKKISYDDLEATVRANIMPLERIFTSSYSDYGMGRLGNGDYGTHNTIIFNAPIEHGFLGNHFRADFRKSGRKNIKYVPKQLNDNTWIAVEEGYQTQANPNNIYNFVGTAGTKEAVDNWIKKYGEFTPLTKLPSNYTFIKDGDKIGVIEENQTSARPLTGLYNTEKEAEEAALDKINFDLANRDENINKGMFGHIRVWQDGNIFNVAELQSDYFQKNNARKNILESNTDYIKAVKESIENKRPITKKLETTKFYQDNESEYKGTDLLTRFTKRLQNNLLVEDDKKIVESVISDLKQEDKKLDKKVEEIVKNLSPQEKQFIASQKEWEKRLVREAIKEASLSEATELRFPTPYTLSVIEGYLSESGSLPYDIIDAVSEDYLEKGDRINFEGDDYTVVNSGYDYIEVANSSDVNIFSVDNFIDDEVNNSTDNDMYDIERQLDEQYTEEEWVNFKEDYSSLSDVDINDIGEETDDEGVYQVSGDKIRDAVESYWRDFYENENVENLLEDMGYTNVFVQDNEIYTTPNGTLTQTLGQPDTYDVSASKESFSIEDSLDSTQQTVARKYEEIADILKQERGEENVEIITDENGFDWYETKLAPEEINQPVVAFQKQFEVPTEEATTIPDCV